MTTFNPDTKRSLEIKLHIKKMCNHVRLVKQYGHPIDEAMRLALKQKAEEYTLERSIVPHSNLKLLQVKGDNHPKTYLCHCDKLHVYDDKANEFIIEALKIALDFFIQDGLQHFEKRLPFYTSAILCDRVINHFIFLITAIEQSKK